MKFLIQRVKEARVICDDLIVSEIEKGLLVFIGIKQDDTVENADYMIKKLINLRVFEDENEKMNLSLKDINRSILIVSQFTLYADCNSGNRPSFSNAAKSEEAKKLYDYIVEELKKKINNVKTGIFGANMEVGLINDGPVTIILEK